MNKDLNLSFLDDVKLEPVSKTVSKTKKPQVNRTPDDNVDIRVFANGTVFPSKAFTAKHSLEYQNRSELPDGSFVIKGNGLDVFSSKEWGMIKGKIPVDLVFVASVAKALPKVDLWGSTKYNDDNTPKASVLTQGAETFGKNTLLPMLADIYGVDWETTAYVDLTVSRQVVGSPDNIYHIPKKVMSGKNKGQATYERRENLIISPLVITHTEPKGGQNDAESKTESEAGEVQTEATTTETVIDAKAEDTSIASTDDWSTLGKLDA